MLDPIMKTRITPENARKMYVEFLRDLDAK